jgi:hypothetical protein
MGSSSAASLRTPNNRADKEVSRNIVERISL